MKNGFKLFLVAVLLSTLLIPIGFLYAVIRRRKALDLFFLNLAVTIDQTGNVFCADLFNRTLLKQRTDVYLFGNPDETISSVLGKNFLNNSLSKTGMILNKLLSFLDDNHSVKSIEHNP